MIRFPRIRRRPAQEELLSFYLQTYRDTDLAAGALERLRRHYPHSRVIFLSDGDDDPVLPALARAFDVEFVAGERLYGPENGGAIVHRMLKLYLRHPTPFLLKIDTDTRIDRPFAWWPDDDDCLFGMQTQHGFLQGGCILFPHTAAKLLHTSRIMLSPALLESEGHWIPKPNRFRVRERMAQSNIFCEDWALLWACNQIGLRTGPHPEIHSKWFDIVRNDDLAYAVVHPDKFLHLPPEAPYDLLLLHHAKYMRLYSDAVYSWAVPTPQSRYASPATRNPS